MAAARLAKAGAVSGSFAACYGDSRSDETPPLPGTGREIPDLAPLDSLMAQFFADHHPPGGSLAVAYHGRLVYARGFGWADVETKSLVEPTSLFRIASVSKPLTAVATLQLIERKKLAFEDRVMEVLKLTPPDDSGVPFDERWRSITIRQLLQHTAGWDREATFDPIALPARIAETLKRPFPIMPRDLVDFMLRNPLQFDPGSRFAYSNFGYVLLGSVIETLAGEPYESCVKTNVLRPLGISRMRLGRALRDEAASGEVRYYDSENRTGPAVIGPRFGETVPLQYGAENFDAFAAHGGWIASAVDLVRFATAFDEPSKGKLLSPDMVAEMIRRPDGAPGLDPTGRPADAYSGCGWNVRPAGQSENLWHTGLVAGTSAILVRRHDGINWAVLFNTNAGKNKRPLAGLIDGLVHRAVDAVRNWPDDDLFTSLLNS
jgi:N-acyl-D-amino-acid deacylase